MVECIVAPCTPNTHLDLIFFSNISRTTRVRDSIFITVLLETMYGLSLGAMTFDLGPRSRGQNAIFANISKTTRDRDFISIVDI